MKEIGRLWRFLMIERETWVAGGIVITVWNAWVYEFPTKSGLKVILGTSTFGVFGATLRALDIGRNTILTLPVVSQDEFSRITEHTNKMIVGLCTCERIRLVFGKYMDVSIDLSF